MKHVVLASLRGVFRSLAPVVALALFGFVPAAWSQGFNIDFGTLYGVPSSSYGAASGQPGSWNQAGLGVTPLVDLSGVASGASVNVLALIPNCSNGIVPSTDDELLLNDCFSVLAGTWSADISGLTDGDYLVFLYATSNTATSTGAMTVGGVCVPGIPGHPSSTLIEDSSWVGVQVAVTGGTLAISGGAGASIPAMAGIQVVPAPPPPLLIWQEDFETDGLGTRYTSNTVGGVTSSLFYFTSNDYWGRVDGTTLAYWVGGSPTIGLIDISSNGGSVTGYSCQSGSFYFAGEDLDATGSDGDDRKQIEFDNININGATGLMFKGLFAAGSVTPCSANVYDSADYIKVYYDVGAGEVLALWFAGGCFFQSNAPLHHDADFDGNGEGTQLVNTFLEWSFPIPDGFASVDIRVEIHMDSPGEEVAIDNFRIEALVPGVETNYCTAGTSANGCQASISATGSASATATSGFDLMASNVEGAKNGIFFFGKNGRQASPWGSGTSYQCVVTPVMRGGLLTGTGTPGLCDGAFTQDLNARWCATCPRPLHNPGAGATVQTQLWYRDPFNTSNQTTSLSDAIEFVVAP
jgi:hypothetical protein